MSALEFDTTSQLLPNDDDDDDVHTVLSPSASHASLPPPKEDKEKQQQQQQQQEEKDKTEKQDEKKQQQQDSLRTMPIPTKLEIQQLAHATWKGDTVTAEALMRKTENAQLAQWRRGKTRKEIALWGRWAQDQ